MGRQIQVCTTDLDNLLFEKFLRENFDCVFLQSQAPTLDKFEINTFTESSFPWNNQIFIWNKQFQWTPEFKPVVTKEKFFISNTSNAPLIEFSKTPWNKPNSHGRVYWTKYFSAKQIEYNLNEFEKFYEIITKWFIKNSSGKVKFFGINIYFLDDAWKRHLLNFSE